MGEVNNRPLSAPQSNIVSTPEGQTGTSSMNSQQEDETDSPYSEPICASTVSNYRLLDFKKNLLFPRDPLDQEKAETVEQELSDISESHLPSDSNKPLSSECSAISRNQHVQHAESLETTLTDVKEAVTDFINDELNRLFGILNGACSEEPRDNVEGDGDAERRSSSRDATLQILLNFLREAKQEDQADCLERRTRSPPQIKFKASLKKNSQYVFEGIPKAGNSTPLNAIYTQLYLTEGGTGEVNSQHEVRQIQTPSRKAHGGEKTLKCAEIFRASAREGKSIRTVMTKGVAGIGKTILTQKFTLDWADGQANGDIDFTFPLPFRKLNVLGCKEYSLVGLLQEFFHDIKAEGICSFEDLQVLFILDGLDECRPPLQFNTTQLVTDATVPSPVDVLLINLIRGTLLPSARVWITTRPAAANQILPEYVDRVTEVRGFTDQQKEEYFRRRFGDERLFSRIMSHIETSRSLHIMCHIPVFCWITATVLDFVLKHHEGGELPKTLTEMYVHFLNFQVRVMKDKYDREAEMDRPWSQRSGEMIKSLGKLAFEQLLEGNLNFYESDLTNCGIDISTASVSGVFTQFFKEERGLYENKLFCFVHLSVQEFLAALHVHLTFTDAGVNLLEQQTASNFQESDVKLLEQEETASQEAGTSEHRSTETYLYLSAVDKALQSPNGHLDLFLRFLLGLSMPDNRRLLKGLLAEGKSTLQTNQETIRYIKQKISKDLHPERSINLFHCLNELNDHSLEEEIQWYLSSGCLTTDQLSSAEWSALVFLLLSSEDLDVFDLKKYSGSEKALLKLLPVLKASNKALLSGCNLSERSCGALPSLLSSQSCSLKTLDLSNNDLLDAGLLLLCDGLRSSSCKLEALRLSGCGITKGGCASLASALAFNPSHLKELDVSYNHLTEAGVNLLSELERDPKYRLDTLRVYPSGAKWLTPGLRKYACKVTLDPKTAPRCLYLFDHNTKIIPLETPGPSCHDHPERHDGWPQVRSESGLTGRCYWEIEWEGEARVAVTYKPEGADGDGCFGMNAQSWSLVCCSNVFYAWHNGSKATVRPPPASSLSNRVGVYLDWPAGTLSFYRLSPEVPVHLHTFNTTFTDSVYPGFGLGEGQGNALTLCKLEELQRS